MWVIAGVLLGLVVLGSLVGFHAGPHTHAAAGAIGVGAAGWLTYMALSGQTAPVLFALLATDAVVSAGVGTAAWKGLRAEHQLKAQAHSIVGAEGVALSELSPNGLVRVAGESWSAVSLNGTVPVGSRIQVIEGGVRLGVWGEDATELPPVTSATFALAGNETDPRLGGEEEGSRP